MANIFGMPSAVAWQTFAKDPQAQLDQFAKDKTTKAATEYFNKNIGKVKTVDDLFKDRKLTEYVLKAYDLAEEIVRPGRIKRMLGENPTASGALVNRMTDTRFKAMATDLRLDTADGLKNLSSAVVTKKISAQFVQAEFERKLGQQDPALREAIYFARKIDDITNVYNVLGDKVLRSVVTATLSLPQNLAIQPVETQARAVEARIKITDFSKGLSTSNITASQKTRAESDIKVLESNLQVADATLKALKPLQTQLDTLQNSYDDLASTINPSGSNAATIALQATAVPALINQENMLGKNQTALVTINTQLDNMGTVLTKLRDPTQVANFSSLKTQFTTAFNALNTAVTGASFTATDGTTLNGLLHTSDQTWVVQPENDSGRITINRFNLADVQAFATQAKASVDAATSAADAGLLQAQSRILQADSRATNVAAVVAVDKTNFEAGLKQIKVFAATLNTNNLGLGARSVDDALTRVATIKTKLAQVKTLAQQSAAMLPSADRSAVQTQFATLRTDIRGLIENTGVAGLDNFLNNQPTTSYEISTGQNLSVTGGHDLLTKISAVLDAGSISTLSGASSMVTTAGVVTLDATAIQSKLTQDSPLLQRAYKTYDPKGRLDSQIYDLQKNISTLIAGTKKNDANLLDSAQSDISVNVASQTGALKLRAQKTFQSDYTAALQSVASFVGAGGSALQNALQDLKDLVDTTTRNVNSDYGRVNFEYAKTGALLDTLKAQEDTATGANATYKTNSYTSKFITRFLLQNGNNSFGGNVTATGANATALSLFDTSQNRNANISSLSLQV